MKTIPVGCGKLKKSQESKKDQSHHHPNNQLVLWLSSLYHSSLVFKQKNRIIVVCVCVCVCVYTWVCCYCTVSWSCFFHVLYQKFFSTIAFLYHIIF